MLDYFVVYQMGILRGLPSTLFYFAYIVMVVFMLNDLPSTPKEWCGKIGEIAVCWAVMQLISAIYYSVFQENYLNQFHGVMVTILYAILRSRYPVIKRIVMGCATWSSQMLLISIYGAYGFPFSLQGMVALTVCLAILTFFFRRFAMDEFPLAPWYYAAVVAALALSGGIAAGNWSPVPGKNPYTILSNSVLLGTVLVVHYIFYHINRTYQRNLELTALSRQQQANQELLAITEKRTEELRILRHELKNNNAYIQLLLKEKRYDELEDYVHQDSEVLTTNTDQVDCGNRLVSHILEQKLVLAKLAGAEIRYQIAIPAELAVAEAELVSLLANLLDNAIEACKGRAEPSVILLRMETQRDYLFIHIENPFEPSASGERRLTLKTTKANQAAHGYGTKIIHRIVEKYNGCAEYHIEGNMFISDVMLAISNIEEGR